MRNLAAGLTCLSASGEEEAATTSDTQTADHSEELRVQEDSDSRSGTTDAVGPPSPAEVDAMPAVEDSYYEDEDAEEVDYSRTGMHAEL